MKTKRVISIVCVLALLICSFALPVAASSSSVYATNRGTATRNFIEITVSTFSAGAYATNYVLSDMGNTTTTSGTIAIYNAADRVTSSNSNSNYGGDTYIALATAYGSGEYAKGTSSAVAAGQTFAGPSLAVNFLD